MAKKAIGYQKISRSICYAFITLVFFSSTMLSKANASEQLYQVELYIFEQPQGGSTELWPNYLRHELTEGLTTPLIRIQPASVQSMPLEGNSPNALAPFEQLPWSEVHSKNVADILDNSRYYRLLYKAAWQQFLQNKSMASPIYVSAGKRTGNQPELEGVLKLYKSRYLHIDAHVILGQYNLSAPNPIPMSPAEASSQQLADSNMDQPNVKPIELYEMKQTRRMRSGELHYLDHPKVGLLIQIHRVRS